MDRKFNTKEIVNMFVDVARISYKYRISHRHLWNYPRNIEDDDE